MARACERCTKVLQSHTVFTLEQVTDMSQRHAALGVAGIGIALRNAVQQQVCARPSQQACMHTMKSRLADDLLSLPCRYRGRPAGGTRGRRARSSPRSPAQALRRRPSCSGGVGTDIRLVCDEDQHGHSYTGPAAPRSQRQLTLAMGLPKPHLAGHSHLVNLSPNNLTSLL